jgi:hypothetical protein
MSPLAFVLLPGEVKMALSDTCNAGQHTAHQLCSFFLLYTVKGARGKVWFDSLNIKYASKLSCCHILLPKWQLRFSISWVTNTPQEKHYWIILKHICHFVSQMILYLGPLLQCSLHGMLVKFVNYRYVPLHGKTSSHISRRIKFESCTTVPGF